MARLADALVRARRPRRFHGFSLIELMVVVAVIAILASIVYPAYENLIQRVRRGEGRAVAMAIAQAQERFFTVNGRYYTGTTPASLFGGTTSPDSALKCGGCAWSSCTWAQCSSAKGYYTLAVAANTVTATRVSGSSLDPYCLTMTVNLRTGAQGGTGSDPTKCW
jgi:type IV pilus assembly protein PilE